MTLVNPLCAVQDIRDQLGDEDSVLPVAKIERAINATSRAVERYCGRRFWKDAVATTRVYRPRDASSVFVHDISDRTGVVVTTDSAGNGTFDTTWTTAEFDLGPRNADVVAVGDTLSAYSFTKIMAIGDLSFPLDEKRARLRVTAKFGWSDLPDDVVEAAIIKGASLFKRKDAPWGIAGGNDFGIVRISRKDPDVIDLLSNFVRFARPEV